MSTHSAAIKFIYRHLTVLAGLILLSGFSLSLEAVTTIDPVNRYAYAANLGWIDWVGDTNNGAVIGEYVCSGYLYSPNVGWINLGNGSPANQIQYQNNSATDFGVNQDSLGNLTGYAWGANIGWINFEQTYGKPTINLRTGQLGGFAWSANCGWISLSNAVAFVQTDSIRQGPLAPDGLPIDWLLQNFGTTNISANADPTGKGNTIGQDYLAGTDPNNATNVFRITAESFRLVSAGLGGPGGTQTVATLTWNSVPSRFYYVRQSHGLTPPGWADSGEGLISPSAGSSTTASYSATNLPIYDYRVEAVRPLYVVQTAGLPDLIIVPAGPNSVSVIWPDTGSYTLQQSSSLAGGGWTASGYAVSTANVTNSITISPPTGNLFFRLSEP